MPGPKPIGPAGRMQRVAEKHQPGQIAGTGSGDLRCDPPAHRLATDRKLIAANLRALADGLDHCPIAGFQPVVPIGYAPALLAVEKIEGERIAPVACLRANRCCRRAGPMPIWPAIALRSDGAGVEPAAALARMMRDTVEKPFGGIRLRITSSPASAPTFNDGRE
jgi:hypothetical protein